jgi:hypothetical protein
LSKREAEEIPGDRQMTGEIDVATEVREFRAAVAQWVNFYLAKRRLEVRPEQLDVAALAALRTWSRGYFRHQSEAKMSCRATLQMATTVTQNIVLSDHVHSAIARDDA